MSSLSSMLAELNAELNAHRTQSAEAHRLLDAAGIGDRGAGLHIRVAALVERQSAERRALPTGDDLAAIRARVDALRRDRTTTDSYVVALRAADVAFLADGPNDVIHLLAAVATWQTRAARAEAEAAALRVELRRARGEQ